MSDQEYIVLNNDVQMPLIGLGTFMLSPDEAEASSKSAVNYPALKYRASTVAPLPG